MRKRTLRCLMVFVTGYSFQLLGCQSEKVGEFLAATINETAVGLSSILISGAIDEALGLAE